MVRKIRSKAQMNKLLELARNGKIDVRDVTKMLDKTLNISKLPERVKKDGKKK